ncbi:hypothetical protein CRG98_011775 [Punica granatum]|uniref:Uncharacterized protein n=1 Tax=Punica granatum TaxID=22663 RepID=A0A2I0KGY9_PUNGR|nr:hypothetical protein CRG98_011775 [Punica granatum]
MDPSAFVVPTCHQLGYMLCYKSHVDELEDGIKKLVDVRGSVHHAVNEATSKWERIKSGPLYGKVTGAAVPRGGPEEGGFWGQSQPSERNTRVYIRTSFRSLGYAYMCLCACAHSHHARPSMSSAAKVCASC